MRRLAVAAVALSLLLAGGASALHEPMDGSSFTFLQAPFTQDVYGIHPSFFGGVAFVPSDGDPLVDNCQFAGSPLHRFDRQGVAPPPAADPTTELHPETTLPSNAGCGLTNHPNSSLYTNTSAGVVRLDPNTGAQTGGPFGPGGNALGIAPDPETGDLVYVGSNGTLHRVDAALTATSVFSAATAGRFIDGIAFDPSGDFLFLASRSGNPGGGFSLAVVNGDTGAFIRDNPMTSEPDGISFHATAPKFVVTVNTDGTMTRHDFPADDYSQASTQSVFASGGFRGDLSAVGPDGCIYLTQAGVRFDNGATSTENSLVKICPGFAPPPGVEVCGDGIDNDGDGLIDEDCPDTGAEQHYLGYDVDRVDPDFSGEDILLTDQFGEEVVHVERTRLLLNPTSKQRVERELEPILRPDDHLECFRVTGGRRQDRIVRVSNQFVENRELLVKEPNRLCAPAIKSLDALPEVVPVGGQHYKCYRVEERPRFAGERVGLEDQFGAMTVNVRRAELLCNPVTKRRAGGEPEPPPMPAQHLVCYLIAETTVFSPRTVFTSSQFGRHSIRAFDPLELCVPSQKVEGPA